MALLGDFSHIFPKSLESEQSECFSWEKKPTKPKGSGGEERTTVHFFLVMQETERTQHTRGAAV